MSLANRRVSAERKLLIIRKRGYLDWYELANKKAVSTKKGVVEIDHALLRQRWLCQVASEPACASCFSPPSFDSLCLLASK
jgi:hypothetical protein